MWIVDGMMAMSCATPSDETGGEQDPMSKTRRDGITNTACMDKPIYERDARRDEIERDGERDDDVDNG